MSDNQMHIIDGGSYVLYKSNNKFIQKEYKMKRALKRLIDVNDELLRLQYYLRLQMCRNHPAESNRCFNHSLNFKLDRDSEQGYWTPRTKKINRLPLPLYFSDFNEDKSFWREAYQLAREKYNAGTDVDSDDTQQGVKIEWDDEAHSYGTCKACDIRSHPVCGMSEGGNKRSSINSMSQKYHSVSQCLSGRYCNVNNKYQTNTGNSTKYNRKSARVNAACPPNLQNTMERVLKKYSKQIKK